jgi:hypothetical protein
MTEDTFLPPPPLAIQQTAPADSRQQAATADSIQQEPAADSRRQAAAAGSRQQTAAADSNSTQQRVAEDDRQHAADSGQQQRRTAVAQQRAFPVSNGRDTHPEETGSEPYSAPDHTTSSHPSAADFGTGSGYSLGGAAAQQALQFALGPAAMDDMESAGGVSIVPDHHALVLADSGAHVIIPVNQQAIAIPPAAKRSARDRSGVGSNPATWTVTETIMLLIANEPSFAPGLQKPDACTVRECALAIIRNQYHYWQQRRDSTSLDIECVRKISGYMSALLGISGPQAAITSALAHKAASRQQQQHPPLGPPSLGPTIRSMKLSPVSPSLRHASSSSSRSSKRAPSACSPSSGGGGEGS